jgi:hypothetical protein
MGEDMIKDYLYLKSEKKPRAREAPARADSNRARERKRVGINMIVVTVSGMLRSFAMPPRRIFQTISDGFIAVRTPTSMASGGS